MIGVSVSFALLKILNHQANVSGGKNNEHNNNDFFHRVNSFRLSIDESFLLYSA